MKFSIFFVASRFKERKERMSGRVNIKKQFSINCDKSLPWHDLINSMNNFVDNYFIERRKNYF